MYWYGTSDIYLPIRTLHTAAFNTLPLSLIVTVESNPNGNFHPMASLEEPQQ
jgi:hypothetical protein